MDVSAEYGGALTILNQMYERAINDKNNKWIFVTSLPALKETNCIKNIRYTWVKKSWFHRLYFDNFIAPRLIKKFKVDEVLSLQNVIIPKVKVYQTVYVHQPLPFIDRRFTFKENKLFWVYQNIIGKIIIKSMKNADKIIVQTKWMKESSIKKAAVDRSKIFLESPTVSFEVSKYFDNEAESYKTFFYPSSGLLYKNHEVIVQAAKILTKRNINFKVIFTLDTDGNKHVKDIYREIKSNNLPIEFAGKLNYTDVLENYTKSVLIFPSYIETFGLPLLEAREHGAPILASNMPFSHEILEGYSKAKYFDSADFNKLAKLMEETINQKNMVDAL